MKKIRLWCLAATLGLSLGLGGCVGVTPLTFGSSIEEVQTAWGKPTQFHTMPDGVRMVYSFGPGGNSVFVAEFDKQGRLSKQYDAMSFPVLARVRAGWKKWEVERELGPAFWYTRYRVSSNVSGVYKYQGHDGRRCFYVEYDPNDIVTATVSTYETNPRDLFPGEREC